MKRMGFVNPNIFPKRNLEYRIRISKAPSLVRTVKLLEKMDDFNSYIVRGEYDIVLVSLESDHFLFRALIDRKLDELQLRDTISLTVDQFLKYHGCVVAPIKDDEDPSFLPPEVFHYLFNVSKDWDSVPEAHKVRLLERNLLMVNTSGVPYEDEEADAGPAAGAKNRTIARLGLYGERSGPADEALQKLIRDEVMTHAVVRSCYSLKSSSPYCYLLELAGSSRDVDDFLSRLHEAWEAMRSSRELFTRCDDVIRKLSEGHSNVLLTIQARPDLVALAEERLIAPVLYGGPATQTTLIQFVERSEALIRSIRSEPVQKTCLEMLSEIQLAFQLNSRSLLQEAVNFIAGSLLDLMIGKFAALYGCAATVEAVIAALKRRGMFREHTTTFGNLYPLFVAAVQQPDNTANGQIFERFNVFRNALVFSKSSDASIQLTDTERQEAELLFFDLLRAIPRWFTPDPRSPNLEDRKEGAPAHDY